MFRRIVEMKPRALGFSTLMAAGLLLAGFAVIMPRAMAQPVMSLIPNRSMPTYVAATATFTPPASATDIVTITGSATKTIRILRIEFSARQTTAGQVLVYLVKRSTANTGGTAVAATIVPVDRQNAAATATVNAYTANPTTGNLVGNVAVCDVLIPAPATAVDRNRAVLFDANLAGQPIVLKGATDCLSINLNGATVTGIGSATATITFAESNNQ